jgi:hypothetical protein
MFDTSWKTWYQQVKTLKKKLAWVMHTRLVKRNSNEKAQGGPAETQDTTAWLLVESKRGSEHCRVTVSTEITWTSRISGDIGCEIQMVALYVGVHLDPAMHSKVKIKFRILESTLKVTKLLFILVCAGLKSASNKAQMECHAVYKKRLILQKMGTWHRLCA